MSSKFKAWIYAKNLFYNDKLVKKPSHWGEIEPLIKSEELLTKLLWESYVPGSNARESLIIAGVQALENRGFDISEMEKFLPVGLKFLEEEDIGGLISVTSKIFGLIPNLKKNMDHPYNSFIHPMNWREIEKAFPKVTVKSPTSIKEKIEGGLYGMISGGSFGTKIEGYPYWEIESAYKDFSFYLDNEVDTTNDDITYELNLLIEFLEKGRKITSEDIALGWVKRIPFGWSAELIALMNIKRGIMPPLSGQFNNPYNEWIGGAMRGNMPGLLSPGDPYKASYLSYIDGVVSHDKNGVYGEMFVAILTSLAFIEEDIEKLIEISMEFIPERSELRNVLESTYEMCKEKDNWREVREWIYKRFERYNWIHLYPNIAIVLMGLMFGKGDFLKTVEIISRSGFDVDCNLGEALGILGVLDPESIPLKWKEALKDVINTYMRGRNQFKIGEIVDMVVKGTSL